MSNIFGSADAWIIVSLDNGRNLKMVLFDLTSFAREIGGTHWGYSAALGKLRVG